MGLRYIEEEDLEELLSACEEILCTLDKPEGWTLGWHEVNELKRAVDKVRGRDYLTTGPGAPISDAEVEYFRNLGGM
jgi:hypothetical protein